MKSYVRWGHTFYNNMRGIFCIRLNHRPHYTHYHSTAMSSRALVFIIFTLCVTYLSHEWENDVTKRIEWIQIGAITNPFWTVAGPRWNVTCPFSIKPKLTKLKISKVLLASCTKTLFNKKNKNQKGRFFRSAAKSGCFYSIVCIIFFEAKVAPAAKDSHQQKTRVSKILLARTKKTGTPSSNDGCLDSLGGNSRPLQHRPQHLLTSASESQCSSLWRVSSRRCSTTSIDTVAPSKEGWMKLKTELLPGSNGARMLQQRSGEWYAWNLIWHLSKIILNGRWWASAGTSHSWNPQRNLPWVSYFCGRNWSLRWATSSLGPWGKRAVRLHFWSSVRPVSLRWLVDYRAGYLNS